MCNKAVPTIILGNAIAGDLLGDLDSLYFDNWDLKLLLDLLSVNSGVSSAIAIIAQFDKVCHV